MEPIWYVTDDAELSKLDAQSVDRMRPLAKKFFELCERHESERKSKSKFEEDYYIIKKRLTGLLNIHM